MLDNALLPAIARLQALPWVERVGGLARPLRIPQEGGGYKTFPVRKQLTAEACRQNKYFDLVPNTAYKSLLYFEQLGPFVEDKRTKSGQYTMQGRVRLIYWLNMGKMGIPYEDYPTISGRVDSQLIATLDTAHEPVTDPQSARISYSQFAVAPASTELFKAYSYDAKIEAFLLWPFDFGAVDFTVSYTFNRTCLDGTPLNAPIECITNW